MEEVKEAPVIKKTLKDDGNIPAAVFFDSAKEFCDDYGVENVITSLQNAQKKFKFTEAQFTKFQNSMTFKIPEIEKALELITQLKKTKEKEIKTMKTKFMLTEGIFSEAVCEINNKVFLWLGANTMVEYTYDEAYDLLKKNLDNAKKNLETYKKDLEFIKDQITITEVNYARVHNYKVSLKPEVQKK